MKKLIIILLIGYFSWGYYSKNNNSVHLATTNVYKEHVSSTKKQQNYQCDGRQHCSQMSSYEEAKYFLENCPNTKMDGDHDGIPCERQFGHY